jgi:hypothetical protein
MPFLKAKPNTPTAANAKPMLASQSRPNQYKNTGKPNCGMEIMVLIKGFSPKHLT